MKKTAGALLLFACCVFAADVWQSKPFGEWSEKDAQKVVTNSPWARAYAISSVEAPDAPPVFGGADGVRNRGIGDDSAALPAARGGAIPANQGGSSSVGGSVIVARWQSALPVREAFARLKYGVAAGTSPEAKQMLDQPETSYLIALSGPLESLLKGNPEDLKRTLINASSLSSKGKGAMRPMDVQINTTSKSTEVVFAFPRSAPYTLDDKEIEFSTKLGDANARYTFRLKDMVFNGKLEL